MWNVLPKQLVQVSWRMRKINSPRSGFDKTAIKTKQKEAEADSNPKLIAHMCHIKYISFSMNQNIKSSKNHNAAHFYCQFRMKNAMNMI